MGCYLLIAATLAAFSAASDGDDATVRLTVQPMPAPRPALKYQLLPDLSELKPGNAAQNYLKCFMEQRLFFFTKEAAVERARYQTMPLTELPVNTLRNYGGGSLRNADWAARLGTVDWQLLDRLQNGGKETLVDELGPFQLLAAAIQVRFRAEVAGRNFDQAIRHAKTMLALARHLGEHPSEVAGLIGLWTGRLALGTVEEMIQQPGCPNLYWALTDLPAPLVDLRKGAQGDRTIVASDLRLLNDDTPMSDAELADFVSKWSGRMGFAREQAGQPPRNLRRQLEQRVNDPAQVRAARQRLIEAGYAPELLKSFPPTQVVLVDEKRDYEIERDDRMKLLAIPFWQIDASVRGHDRGADGDGLFADLLPHTINLRRSQADLEQQIAVLRQVEALRLFAAGHHGKLPKTLAEIALPLPLDPISGQPLVYHVDGATAHIRGGSLTGDARETGRTRHYTVTLK
jgi:hypothetical protein